MSNENTMVREHILHQYNTTKESPFLRSFIRGITDETELGIQDNLSEAMRTLIDFESLQVCLMETTTDHFNSYSAMTF
jgi:hypothetical protein